MKPSTTHYTTTQVNKGGRIANRPEDDDLLRLSFPRTGVQVNQTLPETHQIPTSNGGKHVSIQHRAYSAKYIMLKLKKKVMHVRSLTRSNRHL